MKTKDKIKVLEQDVQACASRVVQVASRSAMKALNKHLGNPKSAIPSAVYDCWLYLSDGSCRMKRLSHHYPPTLQWLVEDHNHEAESWQVIEAD